MRRKPTPTAPEPLLADLVASWLRTLSAQNRSRGTIYIHRKNMHSFQRWLTQRMEASQTRKPPIEVQLTLSHVSRQVIEDHLTGMLERYSVNYTLARYTALSSFLHWCVDEDYLEDSPMRKVKRPKEPALMVPILEDSQVYKLLATCERGKTFADKRDHAIMRVFLSTGMRRAELASLDLEDVDLDGGTVRIKRGKGGEGRYANISPLCVRALDRYLLIRVRHPRAHLSALFLSVKGGRLAGSSVWWVIMERAKACGIEHMHPHLFRHKYAHEFLDAGGQEGHLQALAGWKSSDMIHSRYGKALANDRAIKEARRLSLDEKW